MMFLKRQKKTKQKKKTSKTIIVSHYEATLETAIIVL